MAADAPPVAPPASLRLKLDTPSLAANWRAVAALSGSAATGAAVKANAYGLGASEAVPVLRDAGCDDFFVAHWCEVGDLLPFVPAATISVLHGPVTQAEASFCRSVGAKPVLNSLPQVARWLESGGGRCDLMVDTGINRLGLAMRELGDPLLPRLDLDVCLSHLANADEDCAMNARQLARFAEVRATIPASRYSLANSAGIALGEAYHADLTRPGLALYGGVPRREFAGIIRQVAFPQAAVIQVRKLQAGDAVGYGGTFVADRAMRAGVIALGYADGYLRCWSGQGRFLWNGVELPSLGLVSMDMTVVDLSRAPDCGEGDWLDVAYDPLKAATLTGLSQYELFTLFGKRFARA